MSQSNNKEQILLQYSKLIKYCEDNDYKGWDPYDGLNSKIFNFIPLLRNLPILRLAVIQVFKRSPFNFRKVAFVPKQYNTKALGLMLSGYCNIYEAITEGNSLSKYLGSKKKILERINYLANLVIDLRSVGDYHGACWGYGFGWQSKAFYLPPSTPTVVATSFVVEALLRAYEITKKTKYLDIALSSADFILKDLNRIPKVNGFMFSYSPLDNRAVYNATLLGSKTLSLIYKYSKNECLRKFVIQSLEPILTVQNSDGSFPHSDQVGNKWRDNFHTGFKLESLKVCYDVFKDERLKEVLDKGYNHWITHFFDKENGIAKYYESDTLTSTIDLHCLAQSIPTLYKLNKLSVESDFVEKMIGWANDKMWSKEGFYFFQKKKNQLIKIPYMRWPNSWMFYGISFYLKFLFSDEKN